MRLAKLSDNPSSSYQRINSEDDYTLKRRVRYGPILSATPTVQVSAYWQFPICARCVQHFNMIY